MEANTLEVTMITLWSKDDPSNPLGFNNEWYALMWGPSMGSESHGQIALYSVRWANDFLRRQQTQT